MARILVVDDEKNIRTMVRLTLEKAGHTVEIAEDGQQGLDLFGDGSDWDLTLVDQRMPQKEGREVIDEARLRDPAARIMMMTAFATPELAAAVMQAGATDFLRKPFSADTLRGAVTAALNRPRMSPTRNLPSLEQAGETAEPLVTQNGGVEPQPAVSYFLNGFHFWPLPMPQERPASGFVFMQDYRVIGPGGERSECSVGVTSHVQQQLQQMMSSQQMKEVDVMEVMCQQALLDYLWEQATTPPALLTLYELSPTQEKIIRQMAGIERTTWRIWRL